VDQLRPWLEATAPTADAPAHGRARQALDASAFGLSTGLIYAPSVYADTAELITLGVAGSRAGRLTVPHPGRGPTSKALAEAIRIGEEGGVPVQISTSRPV
jgi:N-acyl-D-aspartate/D-glutamate deacylase